MKLGVKPLKGEHFEVEVALEESAGSLKQKIAAVRPELVVDTQKLVCSGKVLGDDAASLKDLGLKDGDFVVVMQSKPKAAAAPEAAAAPQSAAAPPAVTPAAAEAAPSPEDTAAAAAQAAAQTAQTEEMIKGLCEMGFPRSEVENCLRAAFNNPDRAVEYLMGGIPANMQAPLTGPPAQAAAPAPALAPVPAPAPAPAPVPAGVAPAGVGFPQMPGPGMGFPNMAGAGAAPPASATGPLAKLRQHPRFNEFKNVMQNRPELLSQVLNVWLAGDPSALQLIAEHQQEFVEMLQEPMVAGPQGGDPVAAMMRAMQAAGVGAPAPPGGAGAPPGAGGLAPQAPAPFALSDADKQAIERVMSLGGFPRDRATEAYLACDRNEEMAVNFLFDAMEA